MPRKACSFPSPPLLLFPRSSNDVGFDIDQDWDINSSRGLPLRTGRLKNTNGLLPIEKQYSQDLVRARMIHTATDASCCVRDSMLRGLSLFSPRSGCTKAFLISHPFPKYDPKHGRCE